MFKFQQNKKKFDEVKIQGTLESSDEDEEDNSTT